MEQHGNLLEFFSSKDLQRVENVFFAAAKIELHITTPEGKPLGKNGGHSAFCRLMRENAETGRYCRETDLLKRKAVSEGEKRIVKCKNLGVVSASIPIVVEGAHVANLNLGQAVTKRRSEAPLRLFAERRNIPFQEMLRAYQELPLVSNEEFSRVANLATALIDELIQAKRGARATGTSKKRRRDVLETVLDNLDVAVYVVEPETFRLVYVNAYLCKMLGGEPLEGRLCHDAIRGRAEPCPECSMEKLFEAGAAPFGSSLRYERHNQVFQRDFIISNRLIKWRDGRCMHMAAAIDVTDLNARAFEKAASQIERQFMARMSHELRTPLNGVLGMAQLALQAKPQPKQREYLEKIQSSALLLLGIINDILDYSRIEAGEVVIEQRPFDLHKVVERAIALITPAAEKKKLSVFVDMPPTVPQFIVGDSLRVSQIFLNLLSNAVKFAHEGGVRFSLKSSLTDEGRLRIDCEVADTGVGISEAHLRKLFTPFIQPQCSTAKESCGAKLGLAICKNLLALMGGDIHASSVPGTGSVFSCHFLADPVAEESAELVIAVDALQENFLRGHVLVVEDNAMNQEILLALLNDMGLSADVAENGQKGVEAFLTHDYDMIFMDIQMPVMDGLEASRRIRKSGKHDAEHVPIVALTANAMPEDKEACRDAGVTMHLSKPIAVEELTATVARHLSSSGAIEKQAPDVRGGAA